MKKISIIALILALVVMMSGCTIFSNDSKDLMSPPKAYGEKADIQKLLDEQVSGAYTLKYPKNGLYRSSIVTEDIDNDEEEEAVIFYSLKDSEEIYILFVECKNHEYSVVDEVKCDGNSIDRIDFADIDGNKTLEILIGYGHATTSQNTLNIYALGEEINKLDVSYSYSSLITGDFNSDKKDDVLLLSLFSGDIAAQAKLLIFNNNSGMSEIGTTELDSDITQFAKIQYGQINFGTYGAIVDGVTTAGDYTTQVIYYDNSSASLLNPLYIYSGYDSTRRSTQILSYDFDKDEAIDIPVCTLMMHSESEDTSTVSRQVNWSVFNPSSLRLDICTAAILCPQDGYALTMPNDWVNTVSARYNPDERETTVYICDYVDYELVTTQKLLTIKAFSKSEFNSSNGEYIEILTSGATVYTYMIHSTDSYLSISGEQVDSLFSLVTN